MRKRKSISVENLVVNFPSFNLYVIIILLILIVLFVIFKYGF